MAVNLINPFSSEHFSCVHSQSVIHYCVQRIALPSRFSLFYCSWPNKLGEGCWEEPIFKMPVATSSSDSSKCFGPATIRAFLCLCLRAITGKRRRGYWTLEDYSSTRDMYLIYPILMWLNELSDGALKHWPQICHAWEDLNPSRLYLNTHTCHIWLHVGAHTRRQSCICLDHTCHFCWHWQVEIQGYRRHKSGHMWPHTGIGWKTTWRSKDLRYACNQ